MGEPVGLLVGTSVGRAEGCDVGTDVGLSVGADVGKKVGEDVGNLVGREVVGSLDGLSEGPREGCRLLNAAENVGSNVGPSVGSSVGVMVGAIDGTREGIRDGIRDDPLARAALDPPKPIPFQAAYDAAIWSKNACDAATVGSADAGALSSTRAMIASTRPAGSPYFAARYAFASVGPKPAAIFVENTVSSSDVLAAPSLVYPASNKAARSLSFMSPTFAGIEPNSFARSPIICASCAKLVLRAMPLADA